MIILIVALVEVLIRFDSGLEAMTIIYLSWHCDIRVVPL